MALERSSVDFGVKMKRAREDRGISLRQIAEITHISVSALEALERDDVSRLPGGVFSRGFVRSYASEIGVDPEQAVREFLARFPDDARATGGAHARDRGQSARIPRVWVLAGAGITIVALVVLLILAFR